MAISDVLLCNMALNACNSRSTIQTVFPSDGSTEADTCAIHYEAVRNAVLRAVHWNFARAQLPLAVIGTAADGKALTPWQYMYAYPSDCVKLRSIIPWVDSIPGATVALPASPAFRGMPVRFVESSALDDDSNRIKVVLTNQPQAVMIYTYRVTDTAQFDDLFIEAFYMALAARICIPLSGSAKLAKVLLDTANGHINQAAVTNGNEGIEVQDGMPDWLRVRGYLTDYGFPDQWIYDSGPGAVTLIN